jgi:predicted hexulose-6-phosphate isomerase
VEPYKEFFVRDYQLGLYEKALPPTLSYFEKLTEAGSAGFDYLELSIDESEEKLARLRWSSAERKVLRDAMAETGIPLASMCLSGHRKYPLGSVDPQIRERGMEIMAGAIDLAFDLGLRIIQLAGYDEYYNPSTEETRRLFAENLRLAVSLAARRGILLAFETMETPFMNSVAKAMVHVRAINSPYLQVYPDLGNITNSALAEGRRVEDDLESGRGHLAALHLKETSPNVFRNMDYGDGHVDFDGGIRKARSLGVRMFVGEFWHTDIPDWRGRLRKAGIFLRDKLDRCFNEAL